MEYEKFVCSCDLQNIEHTKHLHSIFSYLYKKGHTTRGVLPGFGPQRPPLRPFAKPLGSPYRLAWEGLLSKPWRERKEAQEALERLSNALSARLILLKLDPYQWAWNNLPHEVCCYFDKGLKL
jgi:hypothetical protein